MTCLHQVGLCIGDMSGDVSLVFANTYYEKLSDYNTFDLLCGNSVGSVSWHFVPFLSSLGYCPHEEVCS